MTIALEPDRAPEASAPARSVVIHPRYNGPRRFANGGYAAGRFAAHLPGPATVVLRRPIPIGRRIALVPDGEDGLLATRGRTLVAEVTPRSSAVGLPADVPTIRAAGRAAARHAFREARHPLSHCYVCSPHRADGLGVTPGLLEGDEDRLGAVFRAPRTVGAVPDELVWAALDCPSYPAAAYRESRVALLGTIAVDILRPVHGGELLAVVGWTIARGARSTVTGSALVDAAGDVVAAAQSTWVDMLSRSWRVRR